MQLDAKNKLDKSLSKEAALEQGCSLREHRGIARSFFRFHSKDGNNKSAKKLKERQESDKT